MFAALRLSALGALSLSSFYLAMWLSLSLSLSLCVSLLPRLPLPIWQVSPPSPQSSGACTMTQGRRSAPTRRPTAIAPTRSSATPKQTFGLPGRGRVPRRDWTSRRREGGGRWGEKEGGAWGSGGNERARCSHRGRRRRTRPVASRRADVVEAVAVASVAAPLQGAGAAIRTLAVCYRAATACLDVEQVHTQRLRFFIFFDSSAHARSCPSTLLAPWAWPVSCRHRRQPTAGGPP